jgi:hypothetical protein
MTEPEQINWRCPTRNEPPKQRDGFVVCVKDGGNVVCSKCNKNFHWCPRTKKISIRLFVLTSSRFSFKK